MANYKVNYKVKVVIQMSLLVTEDFIKRQKSQQFKFSWPYYSKKLLYSITNSKRKENS